MTPEQDATEDEIFKKLAQEIQELQKTIARKFAVAMLHCGLNDDPLGDYLAALQDRGVYFLTPEEMNDLSRGWNLVLSAAIARIDHLPYRMNQ